MKEYRLSPEALVMVQGSSKGTQPQYYENGYWYKQNVVGYEGVAEELVSDVLRYSNVEQYVIYERCRVNGRNGCRSKSFLRHAESFVSFQRLHELYFGESLEEKIRMIPDIGERIAYVVEFILQKTGLDVSNYLKKILTLDMLTLNTDRHFNNLGIVVDADLGIYRESPIFDNGNALLSDWTRFPAENTLEENLESVYGRPFSSSLERQAHELGYGLKLDYPALMKFLEEKEECRAKAVLCEQLRRYEKLEFPQTACGKASIVFLSACQLPFKSKKVSCLINRGT